MFFDAFPFPDQIEAVLILRVPAQYAILHLGGRFVHRILRGIIEFLEQANEFVGHAFLHAEVVDVQHVAFARQRFKRHDVLPVVPYVDVCKSERPQQANGLFNCVAGNGDLRLMCWSNGQIADLG
jgi:hypothetical protein